MVAFVVGILLCALAGAVNAVAPPYGQLSVKGKWILWMVYGS